MTASQHFDVVIVGGGVIGLAIAVRLARRGAGVAVVDAGLPGQASYAAAGMLAPLSEASENEPLLPLGLASLEKYPGFVEMIAELSDHLVQIEGEGILRIAQTEDEAKRIQAAFQRRSLFSLPQELLSADDLREAEPLLTPNVLLAVRSPAERHLQPRRLMEALREAAKRMAVALYHGESVGEIVGKNSRVQSVRTDARTLSCGHLVIAGGAWSGAVAQMLPGAAVPVTPVKGHIAALGYSGSAPLRHTIYAHQRYLLPRENGELVIGTTEEPEAGFDTETHLSMISRLRLDAEALAPALSGLPLLSAWSGLRPASPDGLPILGRISGWENAVAATGHGRNGILLAPHTADLIAACLLDGQDPPEAFAPQRFEVLS